jgi:hypothetical protein
LSMRVLVSPQVAHKHCIGKCASLLEGQAKPLASDGIHAARSVAYQRDIASLNFVQRPHRDNRTALPAAGFRSGQTLSKFGHLLERFRERCILHALGHQDDTKFLGANRSDIRLRPCSPINFDMVRPRLHAIVSAAGPLFSPPRSFQGAPAARPRPVSIGSNDPASVSCLGGQVDDVAINARNGRSPQQAYAALFGPGDQAFVKKWAPQADSRPLREIGWDAGSLLSKGYAEESVAFFGTDLDPERSQGHESFRHHAFAARFFDWWCGTIGNDDLESFLRRCYGRG